MFFEEVSALGLFERLAAGLFALSRTQFAHARSAFPVRKTCKPQGAALTPRTGSSFAEAANRRSDNRM
jgi:hypothetical protein